MQTKLQYAEIDSCNVTRGTVAGGRTVVELNDSVTLTAYDSGKIFGMGTDAKVITLPSATVGLNFGFVNIGVDGYNIITISPAAADGIWGTNNVAAADVDLGGVDNKDLINTKATAIKGDSAHLVCMEDTEWTLIYSTGIWAAEA